MTDDGAPADPVGVVLAGGRSRRMGQDKTLLRPLGAGPTLPEAAARLLASLCSVVIIADRGRDLLAGFESVADGDGDGPAAGILGAAEAYPGRPLLVLAADLPKVDAPLLQRLLDIDRADLICATARAAESSHQSQSQPQPLCALYRPPAIAALRRRVAVGRLAPSGLFDDPEVISHQILVEPDRLLNINRPRDLERFDALRQRPSLRGE